MNRSRALQILSRATPLVAMTFFFAIFVKNAWVCDDAYITFRSIEQLFDGNGPRWNPHERVQVFTSPLWFWTLSAFRLLSSDVFANVIRASIITMGATLFVLRLTLRSPVLWIGLIMLLAASNAFFDYTSSGLENPLCFLVMALFLRSFFSVFHEDADDAHRLQEMRRLFFFVGLLLIARPDLITLVLIPVVYALDRNRGLTSKRAWARHILIGLSPFLAWSLFALIYYGALLPNPAYAKLATGIPATTMWKKGIAYFVWVSRFDLITVFMIGGGVVVMLLSREGKFRAIGFGVLLNLLYILNTGGDFMVGRFLSHAYLVVGLSLAMLVSQATPAMRRRAVTATMVVCAVYWFAWPHTPVKSSLTHRAEVPDENGFADERGVYTYASLYRYLTRDNPVLFPDHKWSSDGLALRNSLVCCSFAWSMGFYGYWAGPDKRITDLFAICDPLLARLPVTDNDWRIGHYSRRVPDGYLETVHHGTNYITDPDMRDFYETVRLVTQSENLFAPKRLRAIVAYNIPR